MTTNLTQLTKLLLVCLERPLLLINKKKVNGACIEFGIGTGAGHQSTLIKKGVDRVNLSYVKKDETGEAFSGMCMERKCLQYLQRVLRVNGYNNNDLKYQKKVAEWVELQTT
eukprot:15332753-Ditylum_brightwellii.AAC.1